MQELAESRPIPKLPDTSPLPALELGLELPSQLHLSAFDISDEATALAALLGSENELPPSYGGKRRLDYLAGRAAAARALTALGISASVGRGVDGLPAWPAGVVGSIAHGGGAACAVVARGDRCRSVGIDVDRVLEDFEALELASSIAHPDELFLLRSALPHTRPGQRLSILFSAKESMFKCLFPLTHEFLEFFDVRLVSLGMASRYQGVLSLRLERSIGSDFECGTTLRARFFLGPERIESAVVLRVG